MLSVPKLAALLAGAALLVAASACDSKTKPTPANFTAVLNAHFLEHPECLLPNAPHFPYETGDPVELKQMNALVDAQLLTVSSEQTIRVSRYDTTPAGARVAPRFCYGHRVIPPSIASPRRHPPTASPRPRSPTTTRSKTFPSGPIPPASAPPSPPSPAPPAAPPLTRSPWPAPSPAGPFPTSHSQSLG